MIIKMVVMVIGVVIFQCSKTYSGKREFRCHTHTQTNEGRHQQRHLAIMIEAGKRCVLKTLRHSAGSCTHTHFFVVDVSHSVSAEE